MTVRRDQKAKSEKQLEDYICTNPGLFFYGPPDEWVPDPDRYISIIGRQISLPHGRLDILAVSSLLVSCPAHDDRPLSRIAVIELKKGALEDADIGQVLRYSWDLQLMVAHHKIRHEITKTHFVPQDVYQEQSLEAFAILQQAQHRTQSLLPVLIGSSCSSHIAAAAHMAGIVALTYRAQGKEMVLSHKYHSIFPDFEGFPDPHARNARFPAWIEEARARLLLHLGREAQDGLHNAFAGFIIDAKETLEELDCIEE